MWTNHENPLTDALPSGIVEVGELQNLEPLLEIAMRRPITLVLLGSWITICGPRDRAAAGQPEKEPMPGNALATVAKTLVFDGNPGNDLPICRFHPYNLNGPRKGFFHNLVTEFGLNPVVMVLCRDYSDPNYKALLAKLDAALGEHKGLGLGAFSVVLGLPEERSGDSEPDLKELGAEARERDKLIEDVNKVIAGLGGVIVGIDTRIGPKDYKIPADTAFYVLLYHKFRVVGSFKLKKGELTAEMLNKIKEETDKLVDLNRKKDEPTK